MGIGLRRVADLVLKLRIFSRLDEGERKAVSVRECFESLLTMLAHRLGDRINVVLQYGAPDVLDCYPGPLNQALMNLMTNAIDAIDGPGTITVTTDLSEDFYRIAVADTGAGIHRDIRDRVLNPFFTTKPVGQGTGLGLSITYSIVKKHGGTLELRDAEGGGTSAIVSLPASSARRN
jgi:two-component system NtrC family sensor kinase